MGSRSGATWKIVIGLAIVCGVLVFAGGFMHRRSLEKSVADTQAASAAFVKTKLTHAVENVDLSEPLNDAASSSLAKEVDPPGDDGVRIFAPNGTAVFTEGVDPFPADDDPLLAAKAGGTSRVIDGPDLRVYAPIEGKGGRVVAVAAVVSNYTQMRKDASGGPLDDFRLPLVGLGVLLLVFGVVLMLQATRGTAPVKSKAAAVVAPPRPSKGKVSGFDDGVVAPVEPPAAPQAATPLESAVAHASAAVLGATIETEPESKRRFRLGKRAPEAEGAAPKEKRPAFGRRSAPAEEVAAPVPAGTSASALQREVAIREALEDQLEQLRTQVKTQKDELVAATRELTAQLEEATRRADEAEARLGLGGAGDAQSDRVAALEQELAQAKTAAAEAATNAEQLQRAAAAAAAPAADQRLAELTSQLADAQQRASSAEQRAASVESVRDELEVRVAQLGSKATDLEQRAADLETSLQEANAGGDAVREEIASLTSALGGANARITELEAMPASPAVDPAAGDAEIARLRGELAKQMERAQAAEDRISTLEADVLAAARGVSALPVEHEPDPRVEERTESQREPAPAAPAGVDRYDEMWSTPYVPPEPAAPAHVEPETVGAGSPPADQHQQQPVERDEPEPSIGSEPDTAAASADPDEPGAELSADDMWSLRARLADAAARKRRHLDVE